MSTCYHGYDNLITSHRCIIPSPPWPARVSLLSGLIGNQSQIKSFATFQFWSHTEYNGIIVLNDKRITKFAVWLTKNGYHQQSSLICKKSFFMDPAQTNWLSTFKAPESNLPQLIPSYRIHAFFVYDVFKALWENMLFSQVQQIC